MKIFVTGSSGFIGKNLLEFYNEHDTFAYTRGNDLKKNLTDFSPNVIIHSAAEIYDSEKMWDSNIILTKLCLDYVKEKKNVKMIHIGSSSEYGKKNRATKETDLINPLDMYQATKGAATLLCQGYARYYDLDICIARPYSVYGKYERSHRLFPKLWSAFNKNIPMELYDGVHDFIYINDFVKGINILVNSSKEKTKGDIVNFGSGIQYTNKHVLKIFQTILGNDAPVTYIDKMNKSFENDIWICDSSYAYSKYKFLCDYNLEQGIRDFIKTAVY